MVSLSLETYFNNVGKSSKLNSLRFSFFFSKERKSLYLVSYVNLSEMMQKILF